MQAFKEGAVRFLICTDVAARGLDISGLPYVVNVTLPDRAEDYIHRVGRVGESVSVLAHPLVLGQLLTVVRFKAFESLRRLSISAAVCGGQDNVDGFGVPSSTGWSEAQHLTSASYVTYNADNQGCRQPLLLSGDPCIAEGSRA